MLRTDHRQVRFVFRLFLMVLLIVFTLAPKVSSESASVQLEQLTLAAPGPHGVGEWTVQLIDKARKLRVPLTIWYPAVLPEGADATQAVKDAEPDLSGAPYPVILFSSLEFLGSPREFNYWLTHLASYGFVTVGLSHKAGIHRTVDRPLDVLYALNALDTLEKGPVVGLADTNNVGVTGYFDGGATTIAAGGAYFDPVEFRDYCSLHAPETALFALDPCQALDQWDNLEAYAQEQGITTGDMWGPVVNDTRIHALLPVVPDLHIRMFGEEGLSAVTLPVMILTTGTSPVQADRQYLYDQLGSTDKFMVSIKSATDNLAIYPAVSNGTLRPEDVAYMNHFATAFFGRYLQGKEDDAAYLTQDFISQFADLELQSSLEQ